MFVDLCASGKISNNKGDVTNGRRNRNVAEVNDVEQHAAIMLNDLDVRTKRLICENKKNKDFSEEDDDFITPCERFCRELQIFGYKV